jgi:hypothetical protein
MKGGFTLIIRITRFMSIVVAGIAVLATSCGGESKAVPENAGSSDLTARAHSFVRDLVGDDREAIRAAVEGLRRGGPEAVPALIQAVKDDHPMRVKVLSLDILGQMGVSAMSAVPFLEELKNSGPGQLSATATTALSRIRTWSEYGFGDLPEDVEVHFVGQDHGRTKIDVVVGRTSVPVVLVLTAEDPVEWTVCTTGDSDLLGILLSGQESQELVEAPPSVPIRFHMSDETRNVKQFHAATEEEAMRENRMILCLTGRRIHKFHGAPSTGPIHIGDGMEKEQ